MKKIGGWKSKITLLFLIILLFFTLVNLSSNWRSNQGIDSEIAQLQEEIGELERENAQFTELIDYFNSTAYIEEKARLDLGLKKEGERVVIVKDTVNDERRTPNSVKFDKKREPTTNPERWWEYFFE